MMTCVAVNSLDRVEKYIELKGMATLKMFIIILWSKLNYINNKCRG